jgi:hypothetical protein
MRKIITLVSLLIVIAISTLSCTTQEVRPVTPSESTPSSLNLNTTIPLVPSNTTLPSNPSSITATPYFPSNSTIVNPPPTTIVPKTKEITQTKEPPKTSTWISPGKVNIGNFYKGATAEWFIKVHNGNSVPTEFSLGIKRPNYTTEGFSIPVVTYEDWLVISERNPTLEPYETRSIPVVLKIPTTVKSIPSKWEVWVSVMDESQTGTVRTELCSRWLVTMR